ncbi:lytic murein transglycosylase B [Methylophaga lonarensis MPL]|uniref:Lytic murein transglycosylase B n=1 Tax=Methylophaga lonarensis MPL TaxID=1286106 RepID=M7PHM0_9GAMM|nr:lytic murein transglycosylase B [Methylophaga lonarensis]EMR13380.1 lytic murein transglycosylase B [Methylophaga lonarensis MPL]
MKQLLIALSALMFALPAAAQLNPELPELEQFIDEVVDEFGFDRDELIDLFAQVEVKESILNAIARPAERVRPWHEYRNIFITPARIKGGVNFWKNNAETLAQAEQQYGVPAEIIVAILGVETNYGGNMGSFRVIDALSTLAFRYPPRSPFFRSELKHFLVLTQEEQMSRLDPVGSYAGAMGLGQFMPSSYRAYAVDFNNDGKRNIWTNPVDAIGSIANYLKVHGWVRGESVVHPAELEGDVPQTLLDRGLKPATSREELRIMDVNMPDLPPGDDKLTLFSLTQVDGEEYWLGRQNFYAITRYNHSRMYAMAVYQLAGEIRQAYEK